MIESNVLRTRNATVTFGLGKSISQKHAEITGAKLPTSWQVLRCMMWHLQESPCKKRSKWEASKIVVQQVFKFYNKAGFPVISERKAFELSQLTEEPLQQLYPN